MKRSAGPGKRPLILGSTRAAQIAFLILLASSAVLVYWWLYDQSNLRSQVTASWQERYRFDGELVEGLLEAGIEPSELAGKFPHLEISESGVRVRPEFLESLEEEARSHLNQYFWEGGFFLFVLIAAMAVLWRVLRQQTELRRRQENFLAAVSHELKTPIASLQLSTETMAMRELSADRRTELLRRSLSDLKRLENLVTNLLDSSRLSEGRVVLERRPVVLAEAVQRAVSEVTHGDGEGVDIQVPAELEIRADPIALATVLRNLIENALKAAAPDEAPGITVEGEARGDQICLRVKDAGVGFPPDEAERLFEKFYRPGDELRRRTRGTGLGLYIVQRFMQLEGGSVTAQSDGPGKGAVFTLAWPVGH